jgi:hypothetical protein
MPTYQVRQADSYGHAVGVLLLEYRAPFIPGDVGNASSYQYPVLFKTVPGLTFEKVLSSDAELEERVIEAAQELQSAGVRGISSDCGFLINYQDAVRKRLKTPVFMSSLLQIPFVAATVNGPIGVMVAAASGVGNRVLELAGVRTETQVVIKGLEDQPHFKEAILEQGGTLNSDVIEKEVVGVAQRMVEEHPDMGAIIMECSLLPPYAKAVQQATQLPVFDFITMIDYFTAGAHRKAYSGYY